MRNLGNEGSAMITIDGAQGEGGGQILRSALSLSILTGKSFQLINIRAHRKRPGLAAQHLKAIDAAQAISQAHVSGAQLHSDELIFEPQSIRTGRYQFEISTAGSTSLVAQTIFLPLSMANSASTVTISGGTHVRWSPSYHYLEWQWFPAMEAMGFSGHLEMQQAGFYPQGGGKITLTIRPAREIHGLVMPAHGKLKSIKGLSAVGGLPTSIADRQKRRAILHLQNLSDQLHIRTESWHAPISRGTALMLMAEFEPEIEQLAPRFCYTSLGEKGKPAEQVADEAVNALKDFLPSPGSLDAFLADQLLLPAACASSPTVFFVPVITGHLLTNAAIINYFLPTLITIDGEYGKPGRVQIQP